MIPQPRSRECPHDVREAWLVVYAYDGIATLAESLAAHAAFHEYLSMRNERGELHDDVDADH